MAEQSNGRGESPSRQAVRRMISGGFSVRQIAAALQISTQAVHKHLRAIRADEATEPRKKVAS